MFSFCSTSFVISDVRTISALIHYGGVTERMTVVTKVMKKIAQLCLVLKQSLNAITESASI